ncbi:ACT domain-containing protein [Archaeoglobus neptunius]|uniref:ACT domain-containing protein n=1 Tax=Archaeoglobus neptunius TaxID=2798580 RepID=UPI0019253522|nr:ACT domain-containing protein [Archaeoglobus neptunius]
MNELLITLIVELEDRPGQLLKVLEPISKMGGNIVGIVHQRGRKTPLNRLPVEISFKIDGRKVERLIETLRLSGTIIRSFNEVRLTATTSVLLIGHLIHTDISDTINSIDIDGEAECVEMHVSMPEVSGPSTAIVTISASGNDKLKEAIGKLREICRRKNIMLIEPINEDPV